MKKLLLTLLFGATLVASEVKSQDINLGKCFGCHGQNFEKVALGKSKIVKDMTKDEITIALIEYKFNARTTPMAGIMYSQMKPFTLAEILSMSSLIKP